MPKATKKPQPSDQPLDEDNKNSPASVPSMDHPSPPMDTVLLDEEENPSDESMDPNAASKPSYVGGGRYNAIKTHHGQVYSGMAIGGSHTWNYDPGIWKETKEEPDRWSIDYQTHKRRARKAPQGSGAPVGTEYHWLIVGHQHVRKVDANTYETHLTGSKYKLAHKTATSSAWSIPTVRGQREREIELLEDAQRRVQGRPPVLAAEKVKVDRKEKGQQRLDALFVRAGDQGQKRKRNNPA
ncbi:hypothetical protein N7510_002591 [Penicillium lagena]|uniref:uncharacterized protein n=1 Tax=Penicillium lagena TaxID=94218 RepID=UPI002540DF6F|nr:uncharacterized protein N7510_002591 [Penicillium lagena]KAJ5626282.1 hypothetical protein N7510_002591 [Penicillium lagena]